MADHELCPSGIGQHLSGERTGTFGVPSPFERLRPVLPSTGGPCRCLHLDHPRWRRPRRHGPIRGDLDQQDSTVSTCNHDRMDGASERAARVVLVGYGLAGRLFHRPLIAATAGLELVTVVTGDPGRRAEAIDDVEGVRVLGPSDEGWLDRSEHDLVVVATPTATHPDVARRAIEARCHVVVDKPLATDAAKGRALANAAQSAGVLLVPFHNRKWDSDHLTLQSLIAEGALGTVFRYESRFERWRPVADGRAWRNDPSRGGGVLLDLGIHLVYQSITLFGPVDRVYAEIDVRRGGADDDVFLALEHASGVRSHLWAGLLAGAPGPRLRVLGSKAAFVSRHVDGQESALRAGRDPREEGFGEEPAERWGRLCAGEEDPSAGTAVRSLPGRWGAFYSDVLASMRNRTPPPTTADEANDALEVLDAARASAKEHSSVRVGRTR
jgi:scyllo-inositol 2-dehydrogenase (NADP+)